MKQIKEKLPEEKPVQEPVQEPEKRSGPNKLLKIVGAVLLWGVLSAVILTFFPQPVSTPVTRRSEPVQMDYEMTVDLIPINPWSRPGTELKSIEGLVIHYVGNPGSSAKGNRDYFASLASGETGIYASSHYIVGLQGEVIQCIPLTEISHGSNHRNRDTVAIEVCHPDDTGKFSILTYDSLVQLAAQLCYRYNLDPKEDIIRHYDVIGKRCPRYYVDHPEAWMQLLADIGARLKEEEAAH